MGWKELEPTVKLPKSNEIRANWFIIGKNLDVVCSYRGCGVSIKETFKPEEWKNLIGLPMLAAYAVAGAAPSGQDDFIREMAGAAQGIIENERTAREGSLLSEVIAEIMANADDDQRGQTEKVSVNDVKQRVLAK